MCSYQHYHFLFSPKLLKLYLYKKILLFLIIAIIDSQLLILLYLKLFIHGSGTVNQGEVYALPE